MFKRRRHIWCSADLTVLYWGKQNAHGAGTSGSASTGGVRPSDASTRSSAASLAATSSDASASERLMAQVGDGDDAIGSVLVSQLQRVALYQPKRLGTAQLRVLQTVWCITGAFNRQEGQVHRVVLHGPQEPRAGS